MLYAILRKEQGITNRLISIIVCFIIVHIYTLDLSAQKDLQFNSDKQFKIVQFTDTHFYLGGARSQEVLDNIKGIMETEKPDLVILTGDIVTGNGENWPTIASWDTLTNLLIKFLIIYQRCKRLFVLMTRM